MQRTIPNPASATSRAVDPVQVASFCLTAVGAFCALFIGGYWAMAFAALAVFVGSFPGRGRRLAMIAGVVCFTFGLGAILLGVIARPMR